MTPIGDLADADEPPPELSVVVPCHNEAESLPDLIAALAQALESMAVPSWEVVLVDDGSTDDTLEQAMKAAAHEPRIKYLSLSRNFGKESAMFAGLQFAAGEFVVLMDGDLQHPPEIIPLLVEAQRSTGADQVIARRDRTGEPLLRRTASRIYYRAVNRFVDVQLVDGEGDFRLMSRRVVDALLSLTEYTRFSKGLFAWVGYPVTVVDYGNVSRDAGQSAWSYRSLANYGVDGVLSFNTKPLRSMILVGWVAIAIFLVYVLWLVINAMFFGISAPGYITVVATIVFFGGIQLLSLGVVGEYVGRIFLEVKNRPLYLVKDASVAYLRSSKAGVRPTDQGSRHR